MSENSEIVAVEQDGWHLGVLNSETLIQDLELAERAGLERPTNIRQIIEKMIADGDLSDVYVCTRRVRIGMPTAGAFRETEVSEYWLTLEQAMFVITRLRTPTAKAQTKIIVRVFDAVATGRTQIVASADAARLQDLAVRDREVRLAQARVMLDGLAILKRLNSLSPQNEATYTTTALELATGESYLSLRPA